MIAIGAAFLIVVGMAMLLRHLRLVNGHNIEYAPGPSVHLPSYVPDLDNLTWIEVRKHFM